MDVIDFISNEKDVDDDGSGFENDNDDNRNNINRCSSGSNNVCIRR